MTQTKPDTLSSLLAGIMHTQDTVYQKKVDEKLRGFLNLSSGKASIVSDLVTVAEGEILRANRAAIWNWLSGACVGSSPLLPPGFPVRFLVAKFGPILVDLAGSAPSAAEFIPEDLLDSIQSERVRRIGSSEYYVTVSLESEKAYYSLASRLNLKISEWYHSSYFGILGNDRYGSVAANLTVTTLSDIVNSSNSGLNGKIKADKSTTSPSRLPALSDIDLVAERLAWFESELALVEVSIASAASHASTQACLKLRRDALYTGISPKTATWLGEPEYLVPPSDATIGGSRGIANLCLGIGILSKRDCYQFIQEWFTHKVEVYDNSAPVDPGPDDSFGRLHFLLAECMLRQETMANERDTKEQFSRCGGVERDIGTPLARLSVYDPVNNPEGIFLCPSYIPSHTIRLTEWFETNLPELKDVNGGFKMHFVHIDSEGEFFQLHTETAGSLIIFTGMHPRVERELLDHVRFKFKLDLSEDLKQLSGLMKSICREFTLSRPDVVFGGDRAACPIASQSKATKDDAKLAWMDSDITGWYWFIEGRPGRDFFCTRSIDQEERITASCPTGFKSLIDCGTARKLTDGCICRKLFGSDWLKRSSLAHPQAWHGYPQSGACSSKNLSNDKLHWTILYYAVADLVKARMLTQWQDTVDVEIVTPVVEI